jgi:uncharacterized YigZ family protein
MQDKLTLKTVQKTHKTSFREKGSKFIGYLCPAVSISQFEQILDKIKSKYPDATHHCYGWRINPNDIEEFAQDDGEPNGTAGLPILNQLKSYNAINCGCIVVRYYGGTNLGKSGLIQAYGNSARLCLNKAELLSLIPTHNFRITYPYYRQSEIDQLKNRFDLKETKAQYLEEVTLDIACRAEEAELLWKKLTKLNHQDIKAAKKGTGFVTLPPKK